jgi:putative oxygen-independent coproporphyrinogen III oxidase
VLQSPPLSLYVHLPWCLRKCPYCDFNSHAAGNAVPKDRYVASLLLDLERELPLVWGRGVQSVFFGGGTPSLFDANHYERLLGGIRALLPVSPGAEVTLEANPGTVEHALFDEYLHAGINRVSLGVQSFDDTALAAIGRIHGGQEAFNAVEALHAAGLSNFNIDLMFGLPGQTREAAIEDVRNAVDCNPSHVSHYQLTIEPNTAFYADPPELPSEEEIWGMQEGGGAVLRKAGFVQYEVSAWAKPDRECRHNLNYWRYGDYIGIGAGAHGKLTLTGEQVVRRRIRLRHPDAWMAAVAEGGGIAEDREVPAEERVFEFFLNQLRLRRGVEMDLFGPRVGVAREVIGNRVRELLDRGLVTEQDDRLVPTELGWRFVNDSQALFLP